MKKYKRPLLLAGVLALAVGFVINRSTVSERYTQVVQEALPKTVTVHVKVSRIKEGTKDTKEYGNFSGSGVFITPNGHILTANHVVSPGYKVESMSIETYDDWIYSAIIVYTDEKKDLALIKIEETGCPYVKLAQLNSVKVGQEVIAIGSPLGLNGTVTTGIISALNRDTFHYDMIQMSAPINPGNSGGPLFDLHGNLIGINVLIVSPNIFFPTWSGIGFSVSANEINRFLVTFHGLDKAIRANAKRRRN